MFTFELPPIFENTKRVTNGFTTVIFVNRMYKIAINGHFSSSSRFKFIICRLRIAPTHGTYISEYLSYYSFNFFVFVLSYTARNVLCRSTYGIADSFKL